MKFIDADDELTINLEHVLYLIDDAPDGTTIEMDGGGFLCVSTRYGELRERIREACK